MSYTLTVTLTLACVMAGEAGPMGLEPAEQVGMVALNRAVHPAFPNSLLAVLADGFNGWAPPSRPIMRLAARLLMHYVPNPHGYLYALSEADRLTLGFPPGDRRFRRDPFELHLYHNWPRRRDRVAPASSVGRRGVRSSAT